MEFFFNIKSDSQLKRGGTDTADVMTICRNEELESIAAKYAAFVNGVEQPGTERFIHASFNPGATSAFDFVNKQISISCIITLNKGVNSVSIRVQPQPDLDTTFRDGIVSTATSASGASVFTAHSLLGHILTRNGYMHVETLIK